MEKSKNKALRYKWHCNAWDIGGKNEDTRRTGTIETVLGECEDIEGFPKLKITNMEGFYELGDCAPLGRLNWVFRNK